MRWFCVLRALLKSTILKKKLFLKCSILKKKIFLKSMILNEKVFVKSVSFNKNFFVLSDFELNFSQRVGFWFEVSTTRQSLKILNWKKYNALVFEIKIFRQVTFWKKFASKKITFWFFLLRENDLFCIFRAFLKSMILNWSFLYVTDFQLKKSNASDFEYKNITTCHILSVLLLQFAKLSFIHHNRACFGKVLMYGFGSISQVILLG